VGTTKVLFTFKVWDELREYIISKIGDNKKLELIFPPDGEETTILELAPQADVLFGWRPKIDLLNTSKNLKLFIQPGTGAEHLVRVFKEYAKRDEVIITNGHGHANEVAQHSIAMILALTNHIVSYHNQMVNGKWRERSAMSMGLKNKKVGFLGYGPINRYVHDFLKPFNLEFSILKRTRDEILENSMHDVKFYTTNDLDKFIKGIDILMIAAPRTKKTENLIGQKELELLSKDGLIINVGRGPIINERDLYNALKDKKIRGAAIDVWYNYQPEELDGKKYPYDLNYPFHELDNILLSPHRAGSPFGELSRWDENLQGVVTLAESRTDFINVINLDEEY
jgi:phosphoglycerate dehydrogenase-like enzyme